MLLTINNLPYTVTYNDIKSLIYSKCGIDEVILDNLVPHENRTKKVTVGLSGEEDANIFRRKIDGAMMNGHQLRVVSKTKSSNMPTNTNQVPSQPSTSGSLQSYMPQGSPWSQGTGLRPPLPRLPSQNVPTMVPPPPMNFSAPNVFYPNQSAYYMMNQSPYPTSPSGPSIGYQTVPYGNASTRAYAQSSWSNQGWNQQSTESQNAQPKKEREAKWEKGDSKWDNTNSKGDKNNSNFGGSNSRWDNNDSKWENKNSQRGNNNRQWDNPSPERGNRRESRWNNSGDSNWDSRNDPRSNSSRDSKWQSSRDSNYDNNYRSNHTAGSSRDRESPDRRYNQNYASRPPPNVYGDHVTYSSGDRFNQRNNEPQQNWPRWTPRKRSPVHRDRELSPPRKQQRNANVDNGSSAVNKGKEPPTERAIQVGRVWRGQFIATRADIILEDPRFRYETVNLVRLRQVLKSVIKRRLQMNFSNDYSMPMAQIEKKYNRLYGFQGDWIALRDSLQKVGGRLMSKVDAVNDMPCKKIKKIKAQYCGPVFPNLKVDHRTEPRGQPPPAVAPPIVHVPQSVPPQRDPPQPKPKNKKKPKPPKFKFGKKKKSGKPAVTPGRIPQYPKGDKKLFRKNKMDERTIMSGDLSAPIFKKLKPAMKKAICEEVEEICQLVVKVCDNNALKDETEVKFCTKLKGLLPDEMSRALKVNLAKRLIPILPVSVRVFASPPIRREPLEIFLRNFRVSSLIKAKQHPYYVAACDSVEEHDMLCLMQPVMVEGSLINFKPLHLVDMKVMKKTDVRKLCEEEPTDVQVTETAKDETQALDAPKPEVDNDDDDVENDDYEVEEYHEDDVEGQGPADEVKEEELCQEMKNIYEQINNADTNENEGCNTLDEKNEENVKSNEEAVEALKSVQLVDNAGNEDFTNDVDIDNNMQNVSEEAPNESVEQCQEGDESQAEKETDQSNVDGTKERDENIDMADVNEEDLEDW